MHLLGKRGTPTIPVTISSNQSNYNLFTAAGSPAYKCNVVLTINTGIVVQGTGSNPAIATTGFAAGSTIKIINNGTIAGKGGDGGGGAFNISPVDDVFGGSAGANGGDAIDITLSTTIDNTNGYIFGGGGGGGGSGGTLDGSGHIKFGGGGGGGGQGYNNAAGGTGGAGTALGGTGTDGGAGSSSGPGTGGNLGGPVHPKAGGDGGAWGSGGADGDPVQTSGGTAGAGGYAVRTHSNSITWLGGNNGTQVKGSVG